MTALSNTARETIKSWYTGDDRIQITTAGYIRHAGWADGKWHGDSCGCRDDRCIGHHHAADNDCGCLPALLDQWVTEQRAAIEAASIWTAYRAAIEANDGRGDQAAYDAAWTSAEAWVRTYQGAGVTSFSLDALVDGHAGISIRTRYNDQDWLVWPAPTQVA